MDFRLTWQVEELTLWDSLEDFEVERDRKFAVNVRRPRPHEPRPGPGREDALCTVMTSAKLPRPTRQALAAVAGSDAATAFEYFPVEIQSELSALQRSMAAVALDVVDLIRWRLGAWGRHNPLRYREFQFRIANGDWRTIAQPYSPTYRVTNPYSIPRRFKDAIQGALRSGRQAPISHSLLREARDQWPADPRSALILAVAALEVGIKHCLIELDPSLETRLVEGVAPPVMTLITHELEQALKRSRPELVELLPPKPVRRLLQQAIQYRNLIVHRPQRVTDDVYLKAMKDMSPVWIDGLLRTISSLLWLFDYCAGAEWARDRATFPRRAQLAT